MKLAVMQPYLFPYIGYFQLLHAVERFVMHDDVAFIKQGWINRNRILINGAASYLTVPLKQPSSFRLIHETKIDDGPQNRCWRDKLLKTVANAYRRAPHFDAVFPLLDEVFASRATLIADLARESIDVVARFLAIATTRVPSSRIYVNSTLAGQDRVIAICRAEGATEYINPIGGAELYARQAFVEAGLALRFLRSQPVTYAQYGPPFVKDLSIIDVLMFNPPETVRAFLDRYDLV